MSFFQKHLAFPSLGIHLSSYTQNWVLKKKVPVVVRPQHNTALAFDMAMSHCWPLLISRSMFMGYFHMTCCRAKSSPTLHLCVLASSSKCILFNREWGFHPMITLPVLPRLCRNVQWWSLKASRGCWRGQPSKCTQLSLRPLSWATLNSVIPYWGKVRPPRATCKKHFTLVLEQFKNTVSCSLAYSGKVNSTKPLILNKTQLDIYQYPGGQLTIEGGFSFL